MGGRSLLYCVICSVVFNQEVQKREVKSCSKLKNITIVIVLVLLVLVVVLKQWTNSGLSSMTLKMSYFLQFNKVVETGMKLRVNQWS